MGSLEELLSSINSGAVNVTSSDAVKRQPRKPKAQTDLQKRLRGQAGAVNTQGGGGGGGGKAAGEKRERGGGAAARASTPATGSASPSASGPASRVTPPPPGPQSAAAASAAGAAGAAAAASGPAPLAPDAPLTMRLKRVLDLLRANRDPHTFADVRAKLHVDLSVDSELLEQLQSHTHVTYDSRDRTLRYRPRVQNINNATDLLNYLRRHTTVEGASAAVPMTGVRVADIADAYLNVLDDIKRLQAEGSVYVFGNTGATGDVIYAVQNMSIGPVGEAVVSLFHSIKLPVDVVDLTWGCRDLGLKSALAARPMRKKDDDGKKDKKKRRKVERRFNVDKATNAHMRELFEGAQPVNIDTK